jgi:quercetin dioxygenase-like cupin family protein
MPSYDFGSQFGKAPATVQFHTFTMKPGDTIPWHYHKALSYVVLERGTLTETHADPNTGACASEEFGAGNAFIEEPNEVHTVSNTGKGAAVITWATAVPTSDGVLQIAPQFGAGGIYFSAPPNCN